MAWNVSPFPHIWVVDCSFFSCFRKTSRVTLVQNCHQSSAGCSVDFRLANIILERLKLAWSKENQTGKNGGKDLAKPSFTQARDTGGWLNPAGFSHYCIWQRWSGFFFVICQLDGCATDEGGILLNTRCSVNRDLFLSQSGDVLRSSACPPGPAFSWVPSDKIFRHELFSRHVGKVKYQDNFLRRWELQMQALNCKK